MSSGLLEDLVDTDGVELLFAICVNLSVWGSSPRLLLFPVKPVDKEAV